MVQRSIGFDADQSAEGPIAQGIADREYLQEILSDPSHPKHQSALKTLPRILAEPKYASLGITEDEVRQWLEEDLVEDPKADVGNDTDLT